MPFELDKDMSEMEADLVPQYTDNSELRDIQLQEVFDRLPELIDDDRNVAVVTLKKSDLRGVDSYPQYDGRTRVTGDLSVTPRLNIAVAIIRKPLVVFRDILQHRETRELTEVSYHFAPIKGVDVNKKFGLVSVQRNVIFKLDTDDDELSLIQKINGLQVFKRFS